MAEMHIMSADSHVMEPADFWEKYPGIAGF